MSQNNNRGNLLMFMHFAFGSLGKQCKIKEQTEQVIEKIFRKKRLLVSKCTEFLPALPELGTKRIPHDRFKVVRDENSKEIVSARIDLSSDDQLPYNNQISYLPDLVSMICFIKLPFNKLKKSSHHKEYGKFGLVFTNEFLHINGIRPVSYYSESSLWHDPLIKQWNNLARQNPPQNTKELQKQILSHRKPATYFQSFAEQKLMKVSNLDNQVTLEFCNKYDRYEVGYGFRNEQEHRIVFDNKESHLNFTEKDLYMIITPNTKSKTEINDYLDMEWKHIPIVKVFPK